MTNSRVPFMVRAFFILGFLLCGSISHAQQVTRINPSHITFRGVSLSSLWTGIIVGDSNYLAITHHAYDVDDTPSFSALQSPFPHSTMLDAVAYAGDTLHAVIAGANGSLAWTSDDGSTWSIVSLGTSATIRAVTWNKSTAAPVLVAVGDAGFVARSTDQGQTWTKITSPTTAQLNAIDFGTPTDAVAVGNDTTMIQSHDGGQTWSTFKFPYDFHTWYGGWVEDRMGAENFSGVAMAGPDSVYVLFDTAMMPLLVYKGTAVDTSQGFYNKLHGVGTATGYVPMTILTVPPDTIFPHYTSIHFIDMPNIPGLDNTFKAETLKLYFTGTGDFDAWNTNPDDSTMTGSLYPLVGDADGDQVPVIMRFRASAFWKQDTTLLIMMVGDECSIYKHTATPYWGFDITRHVLPFPGKLNREEFLAVSTLANGTGYEVFVSPGIAKTLDGGRTLTDLPIPIAPQFDSALDNLYVQDSATLFAVGWSGIILKYDPTGFHFIPSGTEERLEAITFPSPDTGIIVGDFGSVLLSSDRGETWNAVTTPSFERLYSVAFANPRIGIAVGDSATILRTTDEGVTWSAINNFLTGTAISIRELQAFPNGVFLAQAGSALLRSTDYGQNWSNMLPPNLSDTSGMRFYSPQIGMIAQKSPTSEFCPDTARLAYTTDGGVTWTQFSFQFWNYNRVVINWISDHEALIYGSFGFIDDIVISPSGVQVTPMDKTSRVAVYPNPTTGEFRIDYTTKSSGPVTIQLLSEDGKDMGTLFSGTEPVGKHDQPLPAPQDLHGSFYLRITKDGVLETVPVSLR